MEFQTIRIEKKERVGVITLDYPPYNSVSKRMIAELIEAFRLLGADGEVRCIMLRAEGSDQEGPGRGLRDHGELLRPGKPPGGMHRRL